MNNLYLEISPRQTGKTTRLIEAVKKFVEDGMQTPSYIDFKHHFFSNKSLIITKNLRNASILQNKINIYPSSQDLIYKWSNISIYSENQMDYIYAFIRNNIPNSNVRIFLDEFDWLNHEKIIKLIV
jgi:thymidine kinase